MAKKKIVKKKSNENQSQLAELLAEQKKANESLLLQVRLLQEQLNKGKSEDEEKKLQSEAEKIRKDQEALLEEANLRKVLAEASKVGSREEGSDFDELSNKEVLEVLSEALGKSLEAHAKLTKNEIAKSLTSTNEKLDGTQKVLMQLMAGMSVNQARGKFSDFDKHKEAIGKIISAHPSLTPEDAYLLAKAQEASKVPNKAQAESERPNLNPESLIFSNQEETEEEELESETAQGEITNPRVAFRDAASKAIDKVLAARSKQT